MERKPKHSCLQQMVFKSKILGKDKTHLTYKLQCVKFHNKEAKHVSDQKLNERNCFFFFFFWEVKRLEDGSFAPPTAMMK